MVVGARRTAAAAAVPAAEVVFLLMIGGPSATGKSTVAQAVWSNFEHRSSLIDLDAIRRRSSPGQATPSSLQLAHEEGLRLARAFLHQGHSVIVERIFERSDLIEDFRSVAQECGARPLHVLLFADESTRLERHRKRVLENPRRRGVSEDYIRSLDQTSRIHVTTEIDTTLIDIDEVVRQVCRLIDGL